MSGHSRAAFRMLARRPVTGAVIIVTLAIGVGSATAVFAVLHAVLLRDAPYPDADRIVSIATGAERGHFSPPDFIDLVETAHAFTAVCAIQGHGPATLSDRGRSTPIRLRDVTTAVLDVYGVRPLIGRGFTVADEDTFFTDGAAAAREPGAVLIGRRVWQDRFDGDPAVLGRTVQIDFEPYEIVGVMPDGFDTLVPGESDYRSTVDVWRLTRMNLRNMPRDAAFLRVVARLETGVSPAAADADVGAFAARQRGAHALHRDNRYAAAVTELTASLGRQHRSPILLLFGAVALLLLTAGANLATLQLIRSVGRQREFAVRIALGASRMTLVRQVLVEQAAFAAAGAALAVVVAFWLTRGLLLLAPASVPRFDQSAIGIAALVFAVLVTMALSAVVAIAPLLRLARVREQAALQASRGVAGPGPGSSDRRFVVLQVALAVVLSIGTILVARSFVSLLRVDPGFDAERVLTADLQLTASRYPRYPRADARVRLARQLSDRIAALPSVEAAALALVVPLGRRDAGHTFATEDMAANDAARPPAKYRPITPGYFRAAGTRLMAGRDFDWHDLEQDRPVTIVDARLAARAWPGDDPIGKRLRIERWIAAEGTVRLEPLWTEVIGVAEPVRSASLRADDIATVYLPYGLYAAAELSLLVRSATDPVALTESIRREVAAVDAELVLSVRTLEAVVADSLAAERFSLVLLGAFAASGLALALAGIYGVIAQFVALRQREIGVRIALGAGHGQVRGGILASGARLVAAGITIGAAASVAMGRFLEGLLFELSAVDGPTYAAVAAFVFVACVAACDLPARRAAGIDPVITLREE
jgi:putative ABC transport system permease protein